MNTIHVFTNIKGLIAFAILCITTNAWSSNNNSEPFFSDGKRWVYEFEESMSGDKDYLTITVCGDTIVDGVKAKKLMPDSTIIPEGVDPDFYMELIKDYIPYKAYEENGKVMVFGYDGIPVPYLDFNVSIGSSLGVWRGDEPSHIYDEPDFYYEVIGDQMITLYGHERRMLTLKRSSIIFYWIEGIGVHTPGQRTNVYYLFTIGTYSNSINRGAIECYQDDELLYSYDDFENQLKQNGIELASIDDTISYDKNEDQDIFDLMGRKVSGKPSAGLYIVGGKKMLIR